MGMSDSHCHVYLQLMIFLAGVWLATRMRRRSYGALIRIPHIARVGTQTPLRRFANVHVFECGRIRQRLASRAPGQSRLWWGGVGVYRGDSRGTGRAHLATRFGAVEG